MSAADDARIAVIGMAGRFPGANTVDQFWANLCDGVESVTRLPELDDPAQPRFAAAYGLLEGADEFDAEFFGYAPGEATLVDPQQRIFLTCAYEALEAAGYAESGTRASIGVFAGGGTTDYRAALTAALDRLPMVDEWQLRLGTAPDFLATRVAYKLGLTGPAVAVQTACSTSLVAVHLAVQSLLSGDCDVALAGGAAVHVPHPRIRYTEGGIVSPDGHTRTFDADAEGCVGGSAAAVLVLKPLADALADGDHVHAVLLGSAINNDGTDKVGFTAPGVTGQAAVIRAAHLIADVEPDTVTYVEAHGTATRLGDPIEVAALTRAFRAGTDRIGFCGLGSAKTNIGHTDAAAGAVALIKTVLAAEHGVLPPSLNFEKPSPELQLDTSPFTVVDTLRTWRTPPGVPRRAGVSAFGVGGTNAHVVVEQPPRPPAAGTARPHELLTLSARTPQALAEAAARLATLRRERPGLPLADVAWTLRHARPAHRFRRQVVAADGPRAVAALRATGEAVESRTPEIVFLFPGQGGQHLGMAARLYEHERAFRTAFDECADLAGPAADLRGLLYGPDGASRLATIAAAQPAVFAVEYALTRLLASWNIRPDAVAGHSLGAYAAACAAGVLSLSDAVRLVVRRGELLQSCPAGAMLAIRLSPAEAEPLLPPGIEVAAVNGPGQCTAAGPADRIAALATELAGRGLEVRVLSIATAGHSSLVDGVAGAFRDHVAGLALRPARLPMLSDTTGGWADPDTLADPGYWARHLRQPVRFDRLLTTLAERPDRVLVEVGPGRTLVTLARQHPATAALASVQTQPHPLDAEADLSTVLAAAGQLWALGVPVDWAAFDEGRRRNRAGLPAYPFRRDRYLVDTVSAAPPQQQVQVAAAGGDTLLEAFREALGLETFGPADDFFDAGGDSLTATKLAAWVRTRYAVPLTAADIIRGRTAEACARLVFSQDEE